MNNLMMMCDFILPAFCVWHRDFNDGPHDDLGHTSEIVIYKSINFIYFSEQLGLKAGEMLSFMLNRVFYSFGHLSC